MKTKSDQLLEIVGYSNLLIAIGASAQAILSYLLIDFPIQWQVVTFIFFATNFTYHFASYTVSGIQNKRSIWIQQNKKLIKKILWIDGIGLLIIFPTLHFNSIILIATLALFALSYNYPFKKSNGEYFYLRQYSIIKIFLISSIWTFSTVLFPILESGVSLSIEELFFLLFKRFLFVFVLLIPFDIRDIQPDKESNLKTLPILIGEKKSSFLLIFLLLFIVLEYFWFDLNRNFSHFSGFISSIVISSFILLNQRIKRNEFYYLILIDGLLILQPLLVLLFSTL